eukprot:TRINITY_DN80481_c0_g1_i1.p1 TRINITY_DN80481_c0_g1~~TRINITY_DN80481_c0_g1_i1.p1  ORF type:complete len:235 (-),score=72.06 TRINITY_DN80481_c0_g1_i1:12-716(-)
MDEGDDKKWDDQEDVKDDAMAILRSKAIQVEKIAGRIVQVRQGGIDGAALYLSSRGAPAKIETFNPAGRYKVRAIANISDDVPYFFSEEEEVAKFGNTIRKFRVSIKDSGEEDLIGNLPEVTDFIHKARSDGLPVLVHCSMGVSRSASVVIAYMIRYENLSLFEAHARVKAVRDVICPNVGFLQQLGMWEEQCRGSSTLNELPIFKTATHVEDTSEIVMHDQQNNKRKPTCVVS